MGFHITLPSRFWVQLFLTNLISLKCLSSPARGRNDIFHTTFSESRQNGHSRLAFHKHDASSAAAVLVSLLLVHGLSRREKE